MAAVEQQACVQRYGLELTRAGAHVGVASTAAAVPGGDVIAAPVHAAIDVQFDAIRTLQDASLDAIRTVSASGYTTPVEDPITIDIESDEFTPTAEAEPAGEADQAADDAAVENQTLVEGTVDEVKTRVEAEDVDIERVIAAERAGEARVTLLEWLERRLEKRENE